MRSPYEILLTPNFFQSTVSDTILYMVEKYNLFIDHTAQIFDGGILIFPLWYLLVSRGQTTFSFVWGQVKKGLVTLNSNFCFSSHKQWWVLIGDNDHL